MQNDIDDNFEKQKRDILSKGDKSSIGGWDKRIKTLCDKINKKKNFYTTSSCSGRIVVIVERDKKGPGVFQAVFHEKLDYNDFWKYLPKEHAKLDLKFKQEPAILHVACKDLDSALHLLKKAQLAGFKRSGIISSKNRFVCELLSTEKLELPFAKKGKILLDENYLKILLKKANDNLVRTWKKIRSLQKTI